MTKDGLTVRHAGYGAEERRTKEARHRVLVRYGMGLLLALSLMPLTGMPRLAAEPLLDRCREVLAQCLLVLQAASAPLQWLAVALLVAGVLYAVVDRVRLSARVSRLLGRQTVRRPRVGDPVAALAAEFDCMPKVRLVVGLAPNPAFTAGLMRPGMYLAESLQMTLTRAELRAVFRHELHHVRRRDPLRFAGLRFAAKTLFWLPLLRALVEDLMEDAEVQADDFAASPAGGSDPLDVASALVKIGRANATMVAGVAALGGFRLLNRRVRRLADEAAPASLALPWRPMLLSMAALVAIWASASVAPGSADASMTMQWGDRCPHLMSGAQRACPKCDHTPLELMPDCDR